MSSVFCCNNIQPYRPQRVDHELKFDSFLQWAKSSSSQSTPTSLDLAEQQPQYAIQAVRQVNYGPLESKRYFVPSANESGDGVEFIETTEASLIAANFSKVNSYKNFKCQSCNRFFELNLYKKDPVNKHHWRADLARPAGSIDL